MALVRAVLLLLLLPACTAGLDEPLDLPELDRNAFRCEVQPVLAARCAFAGCHASARRPLRLYAVGRMRLGVGWDRLAEPLSADELEANFQSTRGFAAGNAASDLPLLLSKPLDVRAGGLFHRGQELYSGDDVFTSTDDPGYQRLAAWVAGGTAAADCQPITEVMP